MSKRDYKREAYNGFNDLYYQEVMANPAVKRAQAKELLSWLEYLDNKDHSDIDRQQYILALTQDLVPDDD